MKRKKSMPVKRKPTKAPTAKRQRAARIDREREARLSSDKKHVSIALSLIIQGLSKVQIIDCLTANRTIDEAKANALIGEAVLKVRLASEWERDEQAGLMMIRLNEIYAEARGGGLLKEALAAQKELNRVLGLHKSAGATEGGQGGAEAQGELDAARGYLEPLALAPEGTPVSELARLAVAKLARPKESPQRHGDTEKETP